MDLVLTRTKDRACCIRCSTHGRMRSGTGGIRSPERSYMGNLRAHVGVSRKRYLHDVNGRRFSWSNIVQVQDFLPFCSC